VEDGVPRRTTGLARWYSGANICTATCRLVGGRLACRGQSSCAARTKLPLPPLPGIGVRPPRCGREHPLGRRPSGALGQSARQLPELRGCVERAVPRRRTRRCSGPAQSGGPLSWVDDEAVGSQAPVVEFLVFSSHGCFPVSPVRNNPGLTRRFAVTGSSPRPQGSHTTPGPPSFGRTCSNDTEVSLNRPDSSFAVTRLFPRIHPRLRPGSSCVMCQRVVTGPQASRHHRFSPDFAAFEHGPAPHQQLAGQRYHRLLLRDSVGHQTVPRRLRPRVVPQAAPRTLHQGRP
jgi:hypothetical protein